MREVTWKDVAREWAGVLLTFGAGLLCAGYVAVIVWTYVTGGY